MKRLLSFCLFAASISSSGAFATGDAQSLAIKPGSVVAGASLGKWTERWWQWAFAMPAEVSTIADTTGERCSQGQTGPVWFLAGSFDNAPVVRTCIIPAGKYVFFPVINYVVAPDPASERPSCHDVTDMAREITDDADALRVTVNGVDVGNITRFREHSAHCFNLASRTGAPVEVYPSATNGYWIMLRPLPPGDHTIEFSGRLGDYTQSIAYRVAVR